MGERGDKGAALPLTEMIANILRKPAALHSTWERNRVSNHFRWSEPPMNIPEKASEFFVGSSNQTVLKIQWMNCEV